MRFQHSFLKSAESNSARMSSGSMSVPHLGKNSRSPDDKLLYAALLATIVSPDVEKLTEK